MRLARFTDVPRALVRVLDVCLERKLTGQGAKLAHLRHTYPLAPPLLLLLLATVLLCTITIVFATAVALLNCWHLGYLRLLR